WALQDGPRRYGEIKKGLLRDISGSQEIAPRVLSRELKTLAAYGLIERRDYQVVPPKVEYSLTPLGVSLLSILMPIVEWGKQRNVSSSLRQLGSEFKEDTVGSHRPCLIALDRAPGKAAPLLAPKRLVG